MRKLPNISHLCCRNCLGQHTNGGTQRSSPYVPSIQYKRDVSTPQSFNLLGVMLTSTVHRVCPQGWAYLRQKGFSPQSDASAYSLLVSLIEQGSRDKAGLRLISQLKGLLAGQDSS